MSSDKNRLIELLEDTLHEWECDVQTETLSQIADHLLANGIIVPPVILNQMVWCKSFDGINQCKVSSLTQKADGSFKIRLTNLIHKFVFEITPDKIGKTVFLTKEEAEQALAERSGDNGNL